MWLKNSTGWALDTQWNAHLYQAPTFSDPSKLSQYFFSKATISEKQSLLHLETISLMGYLTHPRWHLDNDEKKDVLCGVNSGTKNVVALMLLFGCSVVSDSVTPWTAT